MAGSPSPSWTHMYPIWLVVEQASRPLTSVRTWPAQTPRTTDARPRTRRSTSTWGLARNTGHASTPSTPAPLTTPAWSSAETGDGASAVSANHLWAGTRPLRTTQATTRRAATLTVVQPADTSSSRARSTDGNQATPRPTPSHRATSPMAGPGTRFALVTMTASDPTATESAMPEPVSPSRALRLVEE